MSDYVEKGPDALPIESIAQLVGHFEQGCKPRSEWTVGTEHEKPAVDRRTGLAIPFDGPRGVEAILRAMADRFGWEPQEERGRVIALAHEGWGSVTLEPGARPLAHAFRDGKITLTLPSVAIHDIIAVAP